jgi:hypothetical protein
MSKTQKCDEARMRDEGSKGMTDELKAWLQQPVTEDEERRAATLSLEERQTIESWLFTALAVSAETLTSLKRASQ